MKGSEARLVEFMDGSKKRFVIPVYQRNYDWKEENCKQLFDDLAKVIKRKRSTHFFGSIVSVYQPSGRTTEYVIVDGQQRLTTVSLLMLAIYKLLRDGRIHAGDPTLASRILDEYLIDKYQPEETRIKLKPVMNDREAFSRLFEPAEAFIAESRITANYHYFERRILQNEISPDEIFEAIERLQIINIELTADDDPQLIFESINSTGVDLSEGDKIRNYILMDLKVSLQEKYFHIYWEPIEKLVRREGEVDSVGLFVRDWLSDRLGEIPKISHVYPEFKLCAEGVSEKESLLQELLAAAKCYHLLIVPEEIDCKEVAFLMESINRQECLPAYPFLLRVFRMWHDQQIDKTQLISVLQIVDSYVLRRMICDLPTNSLSKVFVELHRGIESHDKAIPYEERMAYVIKTRSGKARMPDDREFQQYLIEKKVYEMRTKNRAYFFSRLENGTSKTAVIHGVDDVVYEKIRDGEYTIEHVMPQTLNMDWRAELGDDCEVIHETWLHRLGNLTLTAYNSEMGNTKFANKSGRTLADLKADQFGFTSEAQHLFLNSFIADQSVWTLHEMQARAELLSERALKIWPYPEGTYTPPQPDVYEYDLLGHKPGFFTNSKPIGYRFNGVEYKVDSWAAILQQVMKLLAELSTDALRNAAQASTTTLFAVFKTESLEMNEVIPGVFVCNHGSVWNKCNVLKQALSGFPAVSLSIVFASEIENDDD